MYPGYGRGSVRPLARPSGGNGGQGRDNGRGNGRGNGRDNGRGNGRDNGRDRERDRDRQGGGGDRRSQRRPADEPSDWANDPPSGKRQRGESYAGNGRGGGDGPRRGRMTLEEFNKKRELEKLKEEEMFDNVVTKPNIPNWTKSGNSGSQISIIANFYRILTSGSWILNNYRVDFEPEQELTRVKKTLLRPHQAILRGHVFDGCNLYTPTTYSDDQLQLFSHLETGGQPVKITLRHVSVVEAGEIQYLHIYSVIIRSCLRALGLDELGRHFYDKTEGTSIPNHRLQIWPGFSTAVRNFDGGILLNIDMAHKVLRLDTCLELLRTQRDAKSEIIGSIVITHYNQRTYKINDIDYEKNPQSTFRQGDREITFYEYYSTKYPGFPITDQNQPLLVSRPTQKDRRRGMKTNLLLIPELCNLTGLSDRQKQNFGLMRDIHGITSQNPQSRCNKLNTFIQRLHREPDVKAHLAKWKMELDNRMTEFTGRVLKSERLEMKTRTNQPERFEVDPRKADWTDKMKTCRMYSSVKLSHWALAIPVEDARFVDKLLEEIQFVSRQLDFQVDSPQIFNVMDARRGAKGYHDIIDEIMGRVRGCQMIFCVLPNSGSEIYGTIKRRCNIEFGVLSQCFQRKHFEKPMGLRSIVTKLCIQMNAKLGGEPWICNNPFKSSKTMVIGYDVHHGGRGQKSISVGALVATTNDSFSKFYSTVSSHTTQQQLSDNMRVEFTKCLEAFKRVNNVLPNRIIMYRDGVGLGDLKYVVKTEMVQIQEAITSTYQGADLKFNFIIVTKKGNARIFKRDRAIENPDPGTVVDSFITIPERFDFFLVSQQSRHGQTVTPTTYNVLKLDETLSPDKIQALSQKFCHAYYNWCGTVSVPFVCQYAHKLSYLSGTTYRDANCFVKESLADFLYFL